MKSRVPALVFTAALFALTLGTRPTPATAAQAHTSHVNMGDTWDELDRLLNSFCDVVHCAYARSPDEVSVSERARAVIDGYRAGGVLSSASDAQRESAAAACIGCQEWVERHPGSLPESLEVELLLTVKGIEQDLSGF